MKTNIKVILAMLAVLTFGMVSCDDDFSQPPVNVPEGGIGTGTWDDPMTAYQALIGSVNESLGFTPWVRGYIVGYVNTGLGSVCNDRTASFTVPAEAASNILIAMDPEERDWRNCATVRLAYQTDSRYALNLRDHPENLGALVTLKGTTGTKYLGQYGVRDVEAFNFGEQGLPGFDIPDTEKPDVIYSALAADATAIDWVFEDVILPSGAKPIWSWSEYNNSHYLYGTAFGLSGETLAYAISPMIDLTGVTGTKVSFMHAAKFQTTLRKLCGFCVKEANAPEGTPWTEIEIPNWPEAGGWSFVSSGDIDLSAFDGKQILLAFKYASDASGADSWEIKELSLSGKK